MRNRLDATAAIRLGILGTVVIVLLIVSSVQIRSLPFLATGNSYRAQFLDTGGLQTGDRVRIAGLNAGTVTGIRIDGAAVEITFTVDDTVVLGEGTTAAVATATLLGTKELRLVPDGENRLRPGSVIPLERTTSPYDLTDALGDLTDTTGEIDMDRLATSLRTLSETLEETPEDLRAAVTGIERLSETVNSRDDALRSLLGNAEQATAVLAERSTQIDALVRDADVVLGELDLRRLTVATLFRNVSALAAQLTGVVRDNETELAPALDRLESVLDVLRSDQDALAGAVAGLGPYVTQLGEAVASGPFFNSYIQNLVPGQVIEPYVTAALEKYGALLPGTTPGGPP